ncbi:4460_t:CDS:2, partial [Scutellospora calospora]
HTTPEERQKVFDLSNNESTKQSKAYELFNFLNPLIKLPDRQTLSGSSLKLIGVMIVTSEGKPYIWKVMDISTERENYLKVIEKTEDIIDELKNINVN